MEESVYIKKDIKVFIKQLKKNEIDFFDIPSDRELEISLEESIKNLALFQLNLEMRDCISNTNENTK